MKVGVLGAGGMGGTVIEHLRECPEVTEIVAMDVCRDRLRELQEKYDIETTTDTKRITDADDVPLVFVTSPNHTHREHVLRSLAAGKAVMCEKPIATSLRDAREMVEDAERRAAFLQIGFEARYCKLYTKVKEWIDAGLLGQVINTSSNYICCEFHGKKSWRIRTSTGGSMFGEKLSHYVDLPRWFVGDKVEQVYSVCAPNVVKYFEVRDNYHTTWRYSNGAVGHLTFMMAPAATFRGDPSRNVVTQQKGDGHVLKFLIVGTAGAAETDVFSRTIKRWEFGDSPECLTSDWVEDLTWDQEEDHFYFHNTTDQTKDIVHRVSEGMGPRTPARDAYESIKLCFATELSADTGKIVKLDEIESLVE